MTEYLKLKKSNCKNCYKCIRNCPVKSIRFSAGQANIVHDECILCGQCFVVCPQNAKEIVSEREKAQVMLSGGDPVVASIAPSFAANYNGVNLPTLQNALKKLGFHSAEETAAGATLVKNEYDRILSEGKSDIVISSCCHSVNLLIRRYYPASAVYLADVITPMQAHCLDIKRRIPSAKTVFIGPCVAKKDEADSESSAVDAVLTFEELSSWFSDAGIDIYSPEFSAPDTPGGRTRLFPTSGGILKSMNCDAAGYTYMSVDGAENCIAALKDIENGGIHNCFIEMSICQGSCIGGPVMEKFHRSPVRDFAAVNKSAPDIDFEIAPLPSGTINVNRPYCGISRTFPGENDIKEILARMGKHSKEDELNCGTCGYNTCREKAVAVYLGKADLSMCLPFLKEKAENFSGNIINNTPNGIIVLNDMLEVQQINRAAMKIMNVRSESDVLGEPVIRLIDPSDFITVRDSGTRITDKRVYLAEYGRYADETVVYDKSYRSIIVLLRDVTDEENERAKKEDIRRKTVDTTDKVIDKQMRIVQEIASLLGETAAETKIALTKLKESIDDE